MSGQLSTIAHNKIMEFFYNNPTTKLHLRELARQVGLSPTGASKILNKLVKENLILREEISAATFYKPNSENDLFFVFKRASNLLKLRSSVLLSSLIEKYSRPDCIVVFGSYASGMDTEQSDIDIAIITKKHIKLNLAQFEKEFNRKINVLEIDLSKSSKEFKNNLANGSVLFGYLEVIK